MLRRTFIQKNLKAAISSISQELQLGELNAGCFDGKVWKAGGEIVNAMSPIDGNPTGLRVQLATTDDYERCITNAKAAQRDWATYPGNRIETLTPCPFGAKSTGSYGTKILSDLGDYTQLRSPQSFLER